MSTWSDTAMAAQSSDAMDVSHEKRQGSSQAIGDLLNRGKRRRLKALVRRNSLSRNALRGFFQAFNPRDHGQIMKAAERYDNLTKSKGKRNGALGYTGIKVLKVLLECIDYRSGRLEPSYLAICKKAHLSVSAVAEALKRLVVHGFLDLKRRYEETGNTDGGPPVRQITNAYRLMLPALAAKTLRSMPPVPISDDELERRKAERNERERMICQLPEWEQPVVRAHVLDPDLAAALNSLSKALLSANPSDAKL
jgi:hypothetical protein